MLCTFHLPRYKGSHVRDTRTIHRSEQVYEQLHPPLSWVSLPTKTGVNIYSHRPHTYTDYMPRNWKGHVPRPTHSDVNTHTHLLHVSSLGCHCPTLPPSSPHLRWILLIFPLSLFPPAHMALPLPSASPLMKSSINKHGEERESQRETVK